MSADVRLVRVVVGQEKDRDYTAAVAFTDLDGKVVSLAFDGRYDRHSSGGCRDNYHRMTYGTYSDCPVMADEGDMKDSDPIDVIRNLRDALNNLNLGD